MTLLNQAATCLQCPRPFCEGGCPISNAIPKMIKAYREDHTVDIRDSLYMNNPLSIVCGWVCDQQAQCEGHCILVKAKKNAVPIGDIEKEIGAEVFSSLSNLYTPAVERQESVAIVGSGPVGITCALLLRQMGVQVDLYERFSAVGGVLRYGIPDFRLPRDIVASYQRLLEDVGVHLHFGITVGQDIRLATLQEQASAVILGLGVWKQKPLAIPGEGDYSISGVDFLVAPDQYVNTGTVFVLGAGNSAVDAARVAKHQGAKEVHLFARTNRIRASAKELDEAREDGIHIHQGMAPQEILANGVTFEVKVYDEKNEWDQSVATEIQTLAADLVIVSINRGLDATDLGVDLNQWGTIIVDEHNETSVANVFAAGDAVLGAKTVVESVVDAKKIVSALRARWVE